jgi:hypothetical protein
LKLGPSLSVVRSGRSLVLSWPASTAGYQLESTTSLETGAVWVSVPITPVVVGNEQTVTVDATSPAQFIRLRKLAP